MNGRDYVKFVIGYACVSILTKILKGCINEARPGGCYESKRLCKTSGMPSGTGIRAGYVLGFAYGQFEKKMKVCHYLLIFLITFGLCLGRVYMKSHTMIQIIAGYLLGLLLGFVTGKL